VRTRYATGNADYFVRSSKTDKRDYRAIWFLSVLSVCCPIDVCNINCGGKHDKFRK
jgi:hypothetical protein